MSSAPTMIDSSPTLNLSSTLEEDHLSDGRPEADTIEEDQLSDGRPEADTIEEDQLSDGRPEAKAFLVGIPYAPEDSSISPDQIESLLILPTWNSRRVKFYLLNHRIESPIFLGLFLNYESTPWCTT